MAALAGRGVVFAACDQYMLKLRVAKHQLLTFVATVDSGGAEVVRKQEAGRSYLRMDQ